MFRITAMLCLGVLTVNGHALGQDPQQANTVSSRVARDRVKGAMIHGGGKFEWARVIGTVKVLDSRTIEFADGTRIQLDIMSPELGQLAMDGDSLYPCGKEAAEFLRALVGDRTVICFQNGNG